MSIPEPNTKAFNPEIYYCKRAESKLTLDGNLDKEFWKNAEWTNDFVDIEGDIQPKPQFQTRAKILWDDKAIYFGAELMGDEIFSHVTGRDEIIFKDNDFEIFIDPDSDTQCYCEFEMNALNTVWDLLLTKAYRDGGYPMNGFDIKGLKTAVLIDGKLNDPSADNKKWSCEIVMPFETLLECCGQGKEIPKAGEFWRINFSRVQWRIDVVNNEFVKRTDEKGNPLPEDNWVWSPTGIVNMHYPELWGFVFFCDESSNEKYAIPEDEKIKWELRKLYYEQHKIFDETGNFSTDIKPSNKNLNVKIQITDNSFEMSCPSADGKHRIYIFSDGKTVG